MSAEKTKLLSLSLGRRAKDNRPRAYEMSWREFVETLEDNIEHELGVSFSGSEDEEEYTERKSRQGFVAAAYNGNRRHLDAVDERSLIFLDLDQVPNSTFRRTKRALNDLGVKWVCYTTPGDGHALKQAGSRSVRFFIPTRRPMSADEIFSTQCKFAHMLGLWEDGDQTAHQRSRIMYLPHAESVLEVQHDGRYFNASTLDDYEWEPPSEQGSTEWTPEQLSAAGGKAAGVSEWAFETGLEMVSSGRGWAVCCPNAANHSHDDGTDGSTAVLLPDAVHPEVRFQCQHEHCQELNRHQYLAFHMLGVPSPYCPAPHGVSRTQMRDIFGESMHADDLEEFRTAVSRAVDSYDEEGCTDADLMNEPSALFTKNVPIIDGFLNFRSTWYAAGESNIGKSFFVLGAMAAVAAGIPFAGQKVIKSHCFYLDAEGGESSHLRKQALQIKYQDDLDWLHIVDLSVLGWDISTKTGKRRVTDYIRTIAREDPVGMIAFDSLNQTMALRSSDLRPFDENSAADMGEVVRALKEISIATGGSAGVVHHPAKGGGASRSARGSGALHGAVDSAFFIEQPDPESMGKINLYHEKSRNGVKQSPRGFLLRKCKVESEIKTEELTTAYQSEREAIDFGPDMDGAEPMPFTNSPRNETLYLVPVAVKPFELVKGKETAKKTKGPEGLSKPQIAVMGALAFLAEENPHETGFSKSRILQAAGKGANTHNAFTELIEIGLICNARDADGNAQEHSWCISTSIADSGEARDSPVSASIEDLSD